LKNKEIQYKEKKRAKGKLFKKKIEEIKRERNRELDL